jgi:hypothetical protein
MRFSILGSPTFESEKPAPIRKREFEKVDGEDHGKLQLVSAGRVDLHRRLGLAAFALATLMPLLGLLAATDSLRRNFSPPVPDLIPRRSMPFRSATW